MRHQRVPRNESYQVDRSRNRIGHVIQQSPLQFSEMSSILGEKYVCAGGTGQHCSTTKHNSPPDQTNLFKKTSDSNRDGFLFFNCPHIRAPSDDIAGRTSADYSINSCLIQRYSVRPTIEDRRCMRRIRSPSRASYYRRVIQGDAICDRGVMSLANRVSVCALC